MLDKETFKKQIEYLNDLKDVVGIVNKLHKQDENGTLYSHIFGEDVSYQLIYKLKRGMQPWELNKYYDTVDKETEEYSAETPEELWNMISKVENETEVNN